MRWAALLVLLASCATAPKCPPAPPQPSECCESCVPEDVGCGVLVCKPGTGVNCGPCPRFSP